MTVLLSFTLPEEGMAWVAEGLRLVLEGLSIATVAVGLLATLRQSRPWPRHRHPSLTGLAAARLTFGSWLSLALEFQLGADIVATTATPSTENLIQLSVVAVIRTFLNMFLGRELEAERRFQLQTDADRVAGTEAGSCARPTG
ncbi:MAG: DUF1622 domain-containing protein [Cyanobacteriota bacterium]|nr:DUF1622 domain-containing protein [Cyanobacteriota bacterium]